MNATLDNETPPATAAPRSACSRRFGVRLSSVFVSAPKRSHCIQPRPLMPIEAVQWRLDKDESQVRALIDEGELLWAFNIAHPTAEAPAVRVLAQSVEDYLASSVRPAEDEERDWQRVAGLIFPDKPVITGIELRALLSCGRETALRLIRARQFRSVKGSRMRRGPGGSARLETTSVKEWLRGRRML